MKIKMNEGFRRAGPEGNDGPGQEITVPDNIGQAMIDNGVGTGVEEADKVEPDGSADIETAEAPAAPEKATRKRAAKRTRKG